MPANVETAVYANTPAWHREGIVLDTEGNKGLTVAQALPLSGLDWEVVKVPAFAPLPIVTMVDGKQKVEYDATQMTPVPGRWSTVRTSDNTPMGTVGKTWQPVQNAEGFQIIDDLIALAQGEGHQTWIEAAGALDGGKKVWVLAHIDTGMQIAGEDYREYVLFTNGHDGRSSVAAATTNVRVVCENTLALSLMDNQRVVRVRHTSKAGERIKEAMQILGMRNQYTEQLAIQGEFLAESDISEAQFEDFLKSLMPIEEDNTPAATMTKARRDDIRQVYMTAPNLDPIRGTRWGVLQSVVEYADYGREFQNDGTQLKAQWGITATPIKDRAFDVLKDPKLDAKARKLSVA